MQITATVSLDPGESVEDITQEEIDTAFRIEDHCERSRRNFSGSWYELLNRLMDSMAYRTMLAETVKRVEDSGPDEGLYVLDRIPVKDAGTWRFVRDPYGNVRGIEADTVSPDGLASASKIFSRDKFVILPWLPRGSNPWGQGLPVGSLQPLELQGPASPQVLAVHRPVCPAHPPCHAWPRRQEPPLEGQGRETLRRRGLPGLCAGRGTDRRLAASGARSSPRTTGQRSS
jgi:hypothetical protein